MSKKTGKTKQAQPEAAPKAPPAQDGDVEMAKPKATPAQKHQSLDQAKAELDANPGRTSALSDKGHLVREG